MSIKMYYNYSIKKNKLYILKMSNPNREVNTFLPVVHRSYTRRKEDGTKENWSELANRVIEGINEFGGIEEDELFHMQRQLLNKTVLASGRYLWVGGTDWSKNPKNFPGLYNCSSTEINTIKSFGEVAELCLTGCGIGFNLEQKNIRKLPIITTKVSVKVVGEPGDVKESFREEDTIVNREVNADTIIVGDSREGWVSAYQEIIDTAYRTYVKPEREIIVDISNVRPKGAAIKGFGGVANPNGLSRLYEMVGFHLSQAHGRKLTSIDACLIINEFGLVVEEGGIRRSAGIAQFTNNDPKAINAKANLWTQDEKGNWEIDKTRNSLRMANHTLVYRTKPTYQQIHRSVTNQFNTGEGAIQWAGEAVARANTDILSTPQLKSQFLNMYNRYAERPDDLAIRFGSMCIQQGIYINFDEIEYRLNINSINPCGEIVLEDNFCNLSDVHLNLLDPYDFEEQDIAFKSAALFATPLLKHNFSTHHATHQKGREIDPIVGVSISGVFDFFIRLFRTDYVLWWDAGRPDEWSIKNDEDYSTIRTVCEFMGINFDAYEGFYGKFYNHVEQKYYTRWKAKVFETVSAYCEKEGIKVPNRCTTIQPSGTKSLLTGASPGIHPSWGKYWIRRIKYIATDPIVKACLEAGYPQVQSQNDIANKTNEESIIEFPCKAPWLQYVDEKRLEHTDLQWKAIAHFNFYMNAQKHYITHNGSVTINFSHDEITPLSQSIYDAIQNDDGYISVALLARFDAKFPNLPFERISKDEYLKRAELINEIDESIITRQENSEIDYNEYQSACSSGKCQIQY